MATNKKETFLKQEEYKKRWVDAYFNHSFNGRITSKYLKPHLSLDSAEVDAARMLGDVRIKELIEIKQAEISIKEDISLSFLVAELKSIILDVKSETTERDPLSGRILSKPDRTSTLKAIDILGKLGGHFVTKQEITVKGEQPLFGPDDINGPTQLNG